MSDIAKYEKKALALFSEKDIEDIKKFEDLKVKVALIEKQNHEKLAKLFRESGVKSFKGNGLTITYVEPHTQTRVDTKRLKDEGLYDNYSKTSEVKESIRVSVDYEN